MKVLIVTWHPEPRSFNAALFETAQMSLVLAGHTVRVSDLKADRFDPVSGPHNFLALQDAAYFRQQAEERHATATGGFAPDLEEELRKLEWCDVLIFQFPLWWSGLPATLKGWVDRVFAMGRTYGPGRTFDNGVFRGKRAVLSLTVDGPAEDYRPGGLHGDLAGILRPIQRGMLRFVGFDVLAPQVTYSPATLSPAERSAALALWRQRVRTLDVESPIDPGTY